MRKARKFYPLHLITFGAAVPLVLISAGGLRLSDAVIAVLNIELIQSWFPSSAIYFSFNAVSWYLSTYMFIIAASPFIAQAVSACNCKLGEKSRIVICALLMITIVVEFAFAGLLSSWEHAHWFLYIFPPTRLLDFCAGMLLGALMCDRCRPYALKQPAALAVGLCACVAVGFLAYYKIGIGSLAPAYFYSAVWLLPTLVILAALVSLEGTGVGIAIAWPPFVFLGNMSLEFFLIHQLVIRYASLLVDLSACPMGAFLACYVTSWVLSAVSLRARTQGRKAMQR